MEIYYTENIPLHWGAFDTIMPVGAGTSKIGGMLEIFIAEIFASAINFLVQVGSKNCFFFYIVLTFLFFRPPTQQGLYIVQFIPDW